MSTAKYRLKKSYNTITHSYVAGSDVAFVGRKYWIGFESFTKEQMDILTDWFELIEESKEWNIASFKNKNGRILKVFGDDVVECGGSVAFHLKREGDSIYSVKRLSDNCVFSVGDEVEYRMADALNWNVRVWPGKIVSFKITTTHDNKIKMIVEINDNHEWKDSYLPHKFLENIRHQPASKPQDTYTKDDVVCLIRDAVSKTWGLSSFDKTQEAFDKFLKERNIFTEQSRQLVCGVNPEDNTPKAKSSQFTDELRSVINRHSKENGSNTPDSVLATYLQGCLMIFDNAVKLRDHWFGYKPFDK